MPANVETYVDKQGRNRCVVCAREDCIGDATCAETANRRNTALSRAEPNTNISYGGMFHGEFKRTALEKFGDNPSVRDVFNWVRDLKAAKNGYKLFSDDLVRIEINSVVVNGRPTFGVKVIKDRTSAMKPQSVLNVVSKGLTFV